MDRFLGKGLSIWVILELIVLNLAWMLALALPMSVLIAVLLSYGRMASDHEITAMRSSGISMPRIMLPALVFAGMIASFTIYFNNEILPDVNHKARLLGSSIYRKRPDLDITPGYFISDLPEYNLRVDEVSETGLKKVVIFSKNSKDRQIAIFAEEGNLKVDGSQILITLYNGEKHSIEFSKSGDYQREFFDSTRIAMTVDNLELKRRDSATRGDREMSSAMMFEKIKETEKKLAGIRSRMEKIYWESPIFKGDSLQNLSALLDTVTRFTAKDKVPQGFDWKGWNRTIDKLDSQERLTISYRKQINKYGVEIHKKYAMPIACFVFVIMGVPLGIMTRKNSGSIGVAIGMFFIYWASLIAGEELADRLLMTPIMAMWMPNLVFGLIGVWISYHASRERRVWSFKNFISRFKKNNSVEG